MSPSAWCISSLFSRPTFGEGKELEGGREIKSDAYKTTHYSVLQESKLQISGGGLGSFCGGGMRELPKENPPRGRWISSSAHRKWVFTAGSQPHPSNASGVRRKEQAEEHRQWVYHVRQRENFVKWLKSAPWCGAIANVITSLRKLVDRK